MNFDDLNKKHQQEVAKREASDALIANLMVSAIKPIFLKAKSYLETQKRNPEICEGARITGNIGAISVEGSDISLISIQFDAPSLIGVTRSRIMLIEQYPRLLLFCSDTSPPYYTKRRSYNLHMVPVPSAPPSPDVNFGQVVMAIAASGLWNNLVHQPGDTALTAKDLEETIAGTIHKMTKQ